MILRTPPRPRRMAAPPQSPAPSPPPFPARSPRLAPSPSRREYDNYNHSQQIVVYDDSLDRLANEHHQAENDDSEAMLCTYQCRQMVKSEVLETLGIREKQVMELQSEVKSLQEDNNNQEIQKKKLEARVQVMEQELAAANGREKAVQEQFAKEVKQFQEWLQTHIKRCSELEMKLQHEMKLRAEAESISIAANDKVSLLEERLQKSAETAERETNRLNAEISRLQKDSDLALSRIRAENETETCRANNAEQEAELVKNQYEELQKRLSEEAEVAEARKLKVFHANAELLREKLLEEKQRADRAEAALESVPELQLKLSSLENELKSWRSMVDELPGVDSCDDVPRKIAEFQKESMASIAKVGEMSIQIKELQIQMDEQQLPSGIPVTLFTLQSMYAQNDNEKLEFEYESGNMNLRMNEYTSQTEISREVDVFLHKFHSIPAFTANLTVELFNRATMS